MVPAGRHGLKPWFSSRCSACGSCVSLALIFLLLSMSLYCISVRCVTVSLDVFLCRCMCLAESDSVPIPTLGTTPRAVGEGDVAASLARCAPGGSRGRLWYTRGSSVCWMQGAAELSSLDSVPAFSKLFLAPAMSHSDNQHRRAKRLAGVSCGRVHTYPQHIS